MFRLLWETCCRYVLDEVKEKALTPFSLQVHGDEFFQAEDVDPIIVGPYPFTFQIEGVHIVASIREIVNREFREFISRG